MSDQTARTHREQFRRLHDFQKVDRHVHWEAMAFWQQAVDERKGTGGLPDDAKRQGIKAYYDLEARPTGTGGLGLTSIQISGPAAEWHVVEEDEHSRPIGDDLGASRRFRALATSALNDADELQYSSRRRHPCMAR